MYVEKIHCLYDWRWFSMIKQIAWNTFKNTGNISTYLEFVEVENLEKKLEQGQKNSLESNIEKNNLLEAEKQNGNIEVKGNSNSRTQYERL